MTTASTPPGHLDWFREARLGMFIHWGPVSLRGTEIGWSRGAQVPNDEYDNLYKSFNPTKFDADEWMRLARQSGFRYVVPTARHHDGFCLWPSPYTDKDIMSSPFRRDIMGELTEASKRHGIVMATYYSILDWSDPNYSLGSPGGQTTKPDADMNVFMQHVTKEVTDLVGRYDMKLLWFDGAWEKPYTREMSIALNKHLRAKFPKLVINDRVESSQMQPGDPMGDYDTPEQKVGSYNTDEPWESCITLGYQWAYNPNDRYKSLDQVLTLMLQTVTGDGNLLLNVGPDETGQIPVQQKRLILGMGNWLRAYGESVYGTRGGPYKNGEWGGTTRKGNTIYVHVWNWKDNSIQLPALPAKALSVTTLQKDRKVDVRSDGSGLVLTRVGEAKSGPTTVKIEIDRNAWSLGTIEAK